MLFYDISNFITKGCNGNKYILYNDWNVFVVIQEKLGIIKFCKTCVNDIRKEQQGAS